ncbi:MAG: lapK [Rhodocyclaceae bacterium]|nr:lapK [Rhodocyclaceae bacterium]
MASASSPQQPMDTTRRFVRLRGERANGFVEFDFAIGEPEIFIEMILGREAFAEFCAANRVEMLPAQEADAVKDSDWGWRLADATQIRFK